MLFKTHRLYKGLKNRFFRYFYRSAFKKIGRKVSFKYSDTFSFENISIGNNVYIAQGAVFLSSNSTIDISDNVLFGPNVTIITGDHPIDLRGKYIFDIKEKLKGEDLPVHIHTDVWVGTGVIILKGVTIGEGSIIAAAALVTKNVPPYAIVGGVPAKIIKYRGTDEQILKHQMIRDSKYDE